MYFNHFERGWWGQLCAQQCVTSPVQYCIHFPNLEQFKLNESTFDFTVHIFVVYKRQIQKSIIVYIQNFGIRSFNLMFGSLCWILVCLLNIIEFYEFV